MNEDCWLKNNCNRVDCDKFCMRYYKLNYLYNSALISDKQRQHLALRIDADGSDSEAFSQLKQIENNIEDFIREGNNIYIYSKQAGCGKTSWTLRLIQAYFNKIWFKCSLSCKGLFINVPKFLLSLKDNLSEKNEYIEHIKENILDADVVIWDDIGTKVITSFESENLLSMIDARISSNKSNFFTSNLNEDELHEALGDRLYSRIVNSGLTFKFVGSDKRGVK